MTTATIANETAAAAAAAPNVASPLRRAAAWPLALVRGLRDVYRHGLRMPFAAPAIIAIAVIPQALQHVAEIQLGMFASKEAFMAQAGGSTRLVFGGGKVAGLFLCIFAAARFVHCGSTGEALRMSGRDLGRSLFALLIGLAASLPAEWAARTGQPPHIYWAVVPASWLLSFLLLSYLIGALLGDRTMTLRAAFTRGWKLLAPLAILTVAAFWPATTLHTYAHKLAIGGTPALVWALMAADSLLVGLLAALLGSALAVSYRFAGGNPRIANA